MAKVRDAAKNFVFKFMRRRALEIEDSPVLSPTPMLPLEGHTDWISSVAFLPDSRYLISGGWDGTVRKWRATDGRQVGGVMDHGSEVYTVAVSGDGKVIASGGEGTGKIVFWNSETCEKLVESQEEQRDRIHSLSFAPDSQTLASGSGDKSIIVWNVRTGKRVAGPVYCDRGWITSVAFSPAGDKMASAGSFGIRILDSSLKEIIPSMLINLNAYIWSVVWSTDGRQLICGDVKGNIHFLDSSNGAPMATCRGHTDVISSIAVSQDGTFFASASFDRTVRLWDTSTHRQLTPSRGRRPGPLRAVSISRNGRYLACGAFDSKVYIWQLQDYDQTLQENKQDSTDSSKSSSQPAPMGDADPENTGSVGRATPTQDTEQTGEEPGSVQGQHLTRTTSRDSWLDMLAVPAAPSREVPVDDGLCSQFFGEDIPPAPPPESNDVRPRRWKKKAKESSQHLFKQFKHLRDGLLPRGGPSDTNITPRPSSSQKLKDRIHRIRRLSSLMPESAERSAEDGDSDQHGKTEPKSHKRSRTAYNRILQRMAVASTNPPVQQQKWYVAIRDGNHVLVPGPPNQGTFQQQGPQPTPSSSTIPNTASAQRQGSSSSATPTTAPVQGRAQSPSGSSDVEVCGCCGFLIFARRV